jgi:hypothetical protein
MNPKATPVARPNLDVAMFDFADEYAQNPERALYRLQFLLLDEDTCVARVAFVRALAAGRESPLRDVRQPAGALRAEITLLCEEGLFAAHAAGRLTPERARRLAQLTRDPDALLEAHRRLIGEDGDDTPPPAAGGLTAAKDETTQHGQPTGFTALARAGRLADLKERLRPWLPYRLRQAGITRDLDAALAGRFLDYVQTRIEEVRHRRFRELLSVWLSDFARQQDLAEGLQAGHLQPTAADLEADAVEQVLLRPGEHEAAWAKLFRESALRSRVPTARALLAFQAAEAANAPALPNYRRDLFLEVRRAHRDGLELFECGMAG